MAVERTTKKSKARSGNPRVRATAIPAPPPPQQVPDAATSASAWVSKEGRGDAEVILLPSGNNALVRRTGPEAFLEQGLIPDMLTPIVEKAIHSKQGLKPQKQKDMLKDPKAMGSIVEMLDRTLCYAVVEPHVSMPPTCTVCDVLDISSANQHKDEKRADYHVFVEDKRIDGVLYADRVDFDDKMFVMNFCLGGTRDLETFRSQSGTSMAGLFDRQELLDATE